MSHSPFLGKRCRQCDWAVEVRVAAAAEVILCLGLIAIITFEFGEVVVHLTQPRGMRRLVAVFDAPRQFLACGLSLAKKTRNLGVDDAGDPAHDENLVLRYLLCLLKDRDRILHIAIS